VTYGFHDTDYRETVHWSVTCPGDLLCRILLRCLINMEIANGNSFMPFVQLGRCGADIQDSDGKVTKSLEADTRSQKDGQTGV
jgi:hypothetical protein